MKTGRPLEFDPSEALQSATTLFWEKGFEGTSTNELMKVMKLSKSSLYQSFGSKQELFTKCIIHYGSFTMDYLNFAYDRSESPKSFIIMMFRSIIDGIIYKKETGKAENGMPTGCFIVNSACELTESPGVIGSLLTKESRRTKQLLVKVIQAGMQKGEISKKKSAETLATFLFTNLCGLRVMENLDFSKDELTSTVDQILNALN
jgi:TetR/AcrR family transcriptional repressor of nem operon